MEVQTEYANFDLGGLPIGRVKTQGILKTTEASFHNGLGHLMGAVDWDTGVVNAAFVYGPYGEVLESIGSGMDDHLRRFNGKESDQLSKLSYYGYRYYDPLSLSWTQADPLYLFVPDLGLGDPRLMNLYSFSKNNPVRYLDPDGREPKGTVDAGKGDTIETTDPDTIDESYCGRSDAPEDCAGVVRTKDGKLRWVHSGCDDSSHPNCGKDGTESEISLIEDGFFTGLVRALTGIEGLFDPKGDLDDKKAVEGAEILSSVLSPVFGGIFKGLSGGTKALGAADIGLGGQKLSQLSGTVSDFGSTRIITVDMIDGAVNPSAIRKAIPNMLAKARASGVQTLQVQGTLANEGLERLLPKLTKAAGGTSQTTGGRTTLTFDLR
jgi:RHS repeat-associated protein